MSGQPPTGAGGPARPVMVLGSINVDLTLRVRRLPAAGETVGDGELTRGHGGKGANQAVAASRYGAQVVLHGCVGDDADGRLAWKDLAGEGVDVSAVSFVDAATGTAVVLVDDTGENQIAVAPGANAAVLPLGPRALEPAGVLVTCFELPLATVTESVVRAAERGWTVVVNPAPAVGLPDELCAAGPILTPNEHELEQLTGLSDAEAGARALAERTGAPVVVTCGASGALVLDGGDARTVDALVVDVTDTTGAGDVFNGVLAATLAEGQELGRAAELAAKAASLSVEVAGARGGPLREQLEQRIGSIEGIGAVHE